MDKKLIMIMIIERLKKELKRYKTLSMHDALTGLYNRRKLLIDLERYLSFQKRHKVNFIVMMLDVDKFKTINDTEGHHAGDMALKQIAKILRRALRKGDTIYRLSGDEFIIILHHCKKEKLSKKIRARLRKQKLEISIGINKLCENVLDVVDKKMYQEKKGK